MIEGTQSLARLLEKLKQYDVPRSEVGSKDSRAIQNLIDLEFLKIKNKGRGQILVLNIIEGYIQWENNLFPDGTKKAAQTQDTRSKATKNLRNSKFSSQSNPSIEIKIHSRIQNSLGSINWYYNDFPKLPSGKIVLIENLRTFLKSELIFGDCEIAIRYDGIISDTILQLLSQTGREILIAPDYDPVGILSYLNCKEVLGDNVTLYMPSNLHELFRHSNRTIMSRLKNRQTLKAILERELDADSKLVIELIQSSNGGLEQEVLHD